MTLLAAVILGTVFGFVLQRVGASNVQKIWGMLTLTDLHLAKAIMLAIGLSSMVLFAGLSWGWVDSAHISIKASYIGVLVGGALLGLGWALAGYCPGTGVAAAGEGKPDAWLFIGGGLGGALLYMLSYEQLANTFLFDNLAGGKSTLASASSKYPALLGDFSAPAVAISIGMLFVIVAFVLPKRLR